jgi:PAS domain S-box-containing protein
MTEPIETGKQATILLVDDSPVNLELVVESLEVTGYEVLVALDGEEALRRAELALPDLILLDVMMPGLDGFEVCRRLKAQTGTADIPVIFMTSLGSVPDKLKGFDAGAVDYLTKPLQLGEVRARIGTHLKLRALQRRLEEKNARLEREIAERQRLEDELRAREETFRALADNSPDPIFRYDREGRRIYVNRRVLELTRKVPDGLIGASAMDGEILARGEAERTLQAIRQVVARGEPAECEVLFVGPDGRRRIYQNRHAPEFGPDGEVMSVLAVCRDITEIKETQNQLEKTQSELRNLAARREVVLEDERRLVAREMHEDLAQVLVALRMKVSRLRQAMLAGDGGDELTSEMMAMTESAIRRIRGLVASIRPTILELGLVPALEWLADDFTRGTAIHCRLAVLNAMPKLSDLRSTTIFRMVQEILTNVALHAEAGKVEMVLRLDGGHGMLSIKDDGRGIDAKDLLKPRLGLIGLREQAGMLGGVLEIAGGEGKGTTIRLGFPVADPERD